ncbi:MAG: hypothetical protein V5A39_07190 [Haloarculaceae archaeon]
MFEEVYFDASETDDVDTGWIQAYQRFNSFGTFNNKFTDQLNLSDSSQYDQQMNGTMPSDDEGKSDPSDDGQDQEDSDSGDGGTVSEIGPGFGILEGLAALGSSAWLANRIGTENQTDSETGTEPNAGKDSNQETTEGEVNERSDDSPVENS